MGVRVLLYILTVVLFLYIKLPLSKLVSPSASKTTLHVRLVLSVDFYTMHDTLKVKIVSASF